MRRQILRLRRWWLRCRTRWREDDEDLEAFNQLALRLAESQRAVCRQHDNTITRYHHRRAIDGR